MLNVKYQRGRNKTKNEFTICIRPMLYRRLWTSDKWINYFVDVCKIICADSNLCRLSLKHQQTGFTFPEGTRDKLEDFEKVRGTEIDTRVRRPSRSSCSLDVSARVVKAPSPSPPSFRLPLSFLSYPLFEHRVSDVTENSRSASDQPEK